MSLEAMTWAFKQHLRPAEKIVLLALADYADDRGTCWPSVGTLVEKTSLSRRTIQTHIRMLEHLDLLTVEESSRTDGSQSSNRYRLAVEGVQKLHPPVQTVAGAKEPSQEGLDQDITSQSKPIAPRDRTDSKLSPVMMGVARRSGLSEADLWAIGDSIEAWCHRYLGLADHLTVALWILEKSKQQVAAPKQYIQTAIRNTPIEVQKFIDESGLGR